MDKAPLRITRREVLVLGAIILSVTALSTWWRNHQSAQHGPTVAALAKPGDIRMFSSVTCVYCTVARQWFVTHQVAHSECFIERDADCLAQYRAFQLPGTPLLLVRGQLQRGFSPAALYERLTAGS